MSFHSWLRSCRRTWIDKGWIGKKEEMNEMTVSNMPGFSGEDSLYRSEERYRQTARATYAGPVVPSLLGTSAFKGTALGFGCSCSGNICCCVWDNQYCCFGPHGGWCGKYPSFASTAVLR